MHMQLFAHRHGECNYRQTCVQEAWRRDDLLRRPFYPGRVVEFSSGEMGWQKLGGVARGPPTRVV